MDYDPDTIDSFAKLKVQFTSFGGLSLEADDEERFFVAYKLFSERFADEEALFDELCSQALNGDRVVNMDLLEKVESEAKPMEIAATPSPAVKKPQLINTEKRKILNNMSNFSPPKTPRFVPFEKKSKPDSPITLNSSQHSGIHFDEILNLDNQGFAELFVRKLPDELFFYGRRFDESDLAPISIEEQINSQLNTDDDLEKKVVVTGRLLIKKAESGDEFAMLKSGISSIQLDISGLDNFSYFHGMAVELGCLPMSDSELKAVRYVRHKWMPMAPLHGTQECLRVVVAHGPFIQNNDVNPLELLAEKAIAMHAHALILCGPFYDPSDQSKFTAVSKESFAKFVSKLHSWPIKIIVVPNAAQDQLSMQVFPTPAQTLLDFGFSDEDDELSNVEFMTDPCIFDLNGVRFAVTSSQALFHLSKSEKYQGSSQSADRMYRLCEHILTQRSMCPVQQSQGPNVIHDPLGAHLTERPHFLIVPSNLAPMIKLVQNSVFINSRFCNKDTLRYAAISVNLHDARKATGDVNIADYSNVAIYNDHIRNN